MCVPVGWVGVAFGWKPSVEEVYTVSILDVGLGAGVDVGLGAGVDVPMSGNCLAVMYMYACTHVHAHLPMTRML